MAEQKQSALERRLIEAIKERAENRIFEDMPKHIENLKQIGISFVKEYNFTKGDIVVWKNNLKNKIRPAYGEPCFVLDILQTPAIDEEKSAGTPYFNEPLDLVLGMIDEDGDFVVFHYDKRRFEPYLTTEV